LNELFPHYPALAIVLTLSVILLWGAISQFLAGRLGLPSIIFLLGGGLALGQAGLGLIDPGSFGVGIRAIIAISVAIIVFEGALSIDIRQLRTTSRSVLMLITVGACLTWLLAGAAASILLGVPWKIALLYGAIVSVTGPTVIAPIVKRLPLPHHVRTILEAESVLVDAVGVLLTAAMFSYITGSAQGIAGGLEQLLSHLLVGAAVGFVGAFTLRGALLLAPQAPGELVRLSTLATALATYSFAQAIAHESGIAAVAVAGLVAGTSNLPHKATVKQFKGDLVTISLSLVFMLLAAGVNPANLADLGVNGILVVLLLMAVIRPLAVFVSTWGTQLRKRERVFIAWMGPRGIVAASLASLMSLELTAWDIQGAEIIGPLVLLTVMLTVLVEGGLAGWVANRLNIMPKKILIVGGDDVARKMAQQLHHEGEHVTLLDSDPENIRLVQSTGLHALLGDATSLEILRQAGIEWCETLVACSPSDKANLLICQSARGIRPTPRLIARVNESKNETAFQESGIETLLMVEAQAATLAGLVARPSAVPVILGLTPAEQATGSLEVQVGNPAFVDKTLRELKLPDGCLVALVKHQSAISVPTGASVIQAGDRLTLVGPPEAIKRARTLLEGEL
jgi:NhaP-type Na+/H+ or K+/H+ antiporter/K+/H+ antiporter YhaU regulatory subunit KhtT